MGRELKIFSIEELYEKFKKGELDFDMKIQRKEKQWDKNRQSLCILSMLENFPLPELHFIVYKDSKIVKVLDGKQRLLTAFSYMENEFPISDKINDKKVVTEIECDMQYINKEEDTENKRNKFNVICCEFETLPDDLQNKIKNYEFSVNEYNGETLTNEDIEEIFVRINNGVPLGSDQKLRAKLGMPYLDDLDKIASLEFMNEIANITESQKRKANESSIIIQTLNLMDETEGAVLDFTSKGLMKYALKMRKKEDEELKDLYKKVGKGVNYLGITFRYLIEDGMEKEEKEEAKKVKKYLKKLSLPMLISLGYDALENEIDNNDFLEWYKDFFDEDNNESPYNKASDYWRVSTSSSDAVLGRLRTLKENFGNYFSDQLSEDYLKEYSDENEEKDESEETNESKETDENNNEE